jgi:hypothetical protein
MKLGAMALLAFTLSGCTLFQSQKTTSGWAPLAKAKDTDCGRWPMNDKDLGINELAVVHGPTPAFLATGLKRDGSPNHYYAAFDGDVSLDKEDLVPLALGRGAVLAGGLKRKGVPVVVVLYNAKGKATLEVRTVKGNLVQFKGDLAPTTVASGSLAPVEGGAWIVYKKDDTDYALAYLATGGDKVALAPVPGVTFRDAPVLLPKGGDGSVIAVWKEGETGKPFKVRGFGTDGKPGEIQGLDVAVTSQAESWAATNHQGTNYLALVDGDSLIGQASLKVTAFGLVDGGPGIRWTKDAALKDVHVTEPVFVDGGKGLQVLLLKWVDEESTIARYMVAGANLGQPSFSGIFPKGARILDAFGADDDVVVVVRNRESDHWAFRVCEL